MVTGTVGLHEAAVSTQAQARSHAEVRAHSLEERVEGIVRAKQRHAEVIGTRSPPLTRDRLAEAAGSRQDRGGGWREGGSEGGYVSGGGARRAGGGGPYDGRHNDAVASVPGLTEGGGDSRDAKEERERSATVTERLAKIHSSFAALRQHKSWQ